MQRHTHKSTHTCASRVLASSLAVSCAAATRPGPPVSPSATATPLRSRARGSPRRLLLSANGSRGGWVKQAQASWMMQGVGELKLNLTVSPC